MYSVSYVEIIGIKRIVLSVQFHQTWTCESPDMKYNELFMSLKIFEEAKKLSVNLATLKNCVRERISELQLGFIMINYLGKFCSFMCVIAI